MVECLGRDYSVNLELEASDVMFGLKYDDDFREEVVEFLNKCCCKVDRWVYFDGDGYVYGFPSDVDLYLINLGNAIIAADISAMVSRAKLYALKRKVELYRAVTDRGFDAVYMITYYVDFDELRIKDEVYRMANYFGIKIVRPEDLVPQGSSTSG